MTEGHASSMLGPQISAAEALAYLRRRWGLIVGCGLLAAVMAALATMMFIPRQYTARTTLLSNTPSSSSLGASAAAREMLGSLAGQFGTQMFDSTGAAQAVVNSRLVRAKIVRELDLQSRFGVDEEWEARELLGKRTKIHEDLLLRTLTIAVTLKGSPWVRDRGASADQETRSLAADIANAYREQLRAESTRLFRTDVHNRRDFIAQRLKEAQISLTEAEDTLCQWQEMHEVVAPTEVATEMTRRLIDLHVQQEQAHIQAATATGQLRGAREQLSGIEEVRLSSATDMRNPQINELQKQLTDVETQLALAMHGEGKSENHPEVHRHRITIQHLTEQLQNALEEELVAQQRVVSASPVHDEASTQLLQAHLRKISAEAESAALETALGQVSRQLGDIPQEQIEFARMRRDVSVREQVYQMLRMEYEKALIDEHRIVDSFLVLDEAIAPERKSGPKIGSSVLIAGIAGMLFAILYVLAAFAISTERKA